MALALAPTTLCCLPCCARASRGRLPMPNVSDFPLHAEDALLIVDVQQDFLSVGSLAVPAGDEVVRPLRAWIERFTAAGLPVFATRDWHPQDHCSFRTQGGPWPPHCIAGSIGARFATGLALPETVCVISKATLPDVEVYSGFKGTDLDLQLRHAGCRRLLIGGLATDYCVLHTVQDALGLGYRVVLLLAAIRAVELSPGDGARAIAAMTAMGAVPLDA